MHSKNIVPDKSISLFVKNILLFEEPGAIKNTRLPFFADGYPGIMFQETQDGLYVSPHNKKMPLFFVYGQTIMPIVLQIKGKCKLIVFQLYPFILKSFFNISAIDVNDSCYDLQQIDQGKDAIQKLTKAKQSDRRIEIIANFLLRLFHYKQRNLDMTVKQAIELILHHKGQISVKEICEKIHLTARTFERRFLKETGITPKHFSRITQFHQSLEQLTSKEFINLTDVVYQNGFADQSHFIRVFKAFTGKTPTSFLTGS